LNGGANQCVIWEAFARRGLGYSALQGSTGSKADGTEAYDLPPNTASFDTPLSTICITEGIQPGLSGGNPTGGVYSGPGVTDNGDNTFDFDPAIAGVGNIIVTYTVLDGCSGMIGQFDDTIIVTDGDPVLVCQDISVSLDGGGNATIEDYHVVANLLPGVGYTIDQSGVFAPVDISSGSTNLSLGDDQGSGSISLGFSFTFFEVVYANFYISSNGYLTFSSTDQTDPSPDLLPSATEPDNIIAAVWDDLDPSDGGVIRYKLTGNAPSRVMVVDYVDVPHFKQGGGPPSNNLITTQIQLFEGSGRIEIHTTRADSDGNNTVRTQGIENADGSVSYVTSGRNFANWSLPNGSSDFVAFIPNPGNLADNCGNSVSISLSKSSFTCKDVGTNIIVVTADDGNGNISTCNATVTVVSNPTVFSAGTWDNGVPNLGSSAKFSDDYNTATDGNIEACSCEIDSAVTVTIGADDYMLVDGNIVVDGSLIVEHQGSLVQVDSDALVVNNGLINVELTTPVLQTRDFMVMGSPMDSETRTGVFNSAFLVLEHTPANFIPHPSVPAGGTSFADDNGDFWSQMASGDINVGEGFIVRPQSSYIDPANIAYDFTHSLGTLNNGDYNRTISFNGLGPNPDGTPNVLANPYPSAIFADDLITDNGLNEVYFWEHLTPPSDTIPGSNSINFSMGDVSMYNLSGGVKAFNDPGTSTVPNGYISTGQGFAIQAQGAGTVTFTNTMRRTTGNTTLRTPLTAAQDINRIWLNLSSSSYEVGSTSLIGFNPEATSELDPGYDSNRLANLVSLYSQLEDGSEQLGIQSREVFENGIKVLMGFDSQIDELTYYTISIDQLEGLEISDATVYLYDNQENVLTNLNETDYSFVSDKGNFPSRFTLQFEADAILETPDLVLSNILVYPNPTKDEVNIVSQGEPILKIVIYDLLGRNIAEFSYQDQRNATLDLRNFQNSLYFLKIHTESENITKRIVKK
jgi:hypothetical protein